MVAVSTLRFPGSSAPTPFQPRRIHYTGGMGAISTLRGVAAASPALPHARRLLYADEVGPSSSLRVVAATSASLPHALRLPYAGEVGAFSSHRVMAAASHALPQAPRLPYAGEIGAISSLGVVARPQRRVFDFPGSSHFTAGAPGLQPHCLPPHLDEKDLPKSPTTPKMPEWWHGARNFSLMTTECPVAHILTVLVLSGLKSSEFTAFVEWSIARLKLPPKVSVAILIGATAITYLFDAVVIGKEINEVCEYLATYRRKVQDDTASSTSER